MKLNYALTCLCLGGIVAFSTACRSTLKTTYAPFYKPDYSNVAKAPVTLQTVSDRRSTKPNVYYLNSNNGDTGQFDRPAADIVREAVAAELQRAGLTLGDTASSAVALNCQVLELQANITEPFMRSPTLDLSVAILFEWKDTKNGSLLGSNERSEHRSRKLPAGIVPHLGSLDHEIVQGYGNELINDMLPRVIEKELRSTSFLQRASKPPSSAQTQP
jgi:hypothetical protein